MAVDLSGCLVIGISSRALFDLEQENTIFEQEGIDAYTAYQREHEQDILPKGTAFHLVESLLQLNSTTVVREAADRLVEVVVMSRNTPDTGMRILNSIEHYGLDIQRAAFTGGESLATYLEAFSVDLFLSKSESDVQTAVNNGVAAAVIYAPPEGYSPDTTKIRIAFDGDAVLFSEESERIYKEQGLEAFLAHEKMNKDNPLPEGPFAKLLKTLSFIQRQFPAEGSPVRLAIVTARSSPAHLRVIQTLRTWDVTVDEAFFLGGVPKDNILKAFKAHIFFDDQDTHLSSTSRYVPSGKVPYKMASLEKSRGE